MSSPPPSGDNTPYYTTCIAWGLVCDQQPGLACFQCNTSKIKCNQSRKRAQAQSQSKPNEELNTDLKPIPKTPSHSRRQCSQFWPQATSQPRHPTPQSPNPPPKCQHKHLKAANNPPMPGLFKVIAQQLGTRKKAKGTWPSCYQMKNQQLSCSV